MNNMKNNQKNKNKNKTDHIVLKFSNGNNNNKVVE